MLGVGLPPTAGCGTTGTSINGPSITTPTKPVLILQTAGPLILSGLDCALRSCVSTCVWFLPSAAYLLLVDSLLDEAVRLSGHTPPQAVSLEPLWLACITHHPWRCSLVKFASCRWVIPTHVAMLSLGHVLILDAEATGDSPTIS